MNPVDEKGGGYEQPAEILKALGHPIRLQIVLALAERSWCVCDLAEELGIRQPYLSQQLAYLRRAGVVRGEREGLRVAYRLDVPGIGSFVKTLLAMDLEG